MKFLKYLFWTLIVIGISLLTYYTYIGGFSKVQIAEEEIGPYTFIQVERWGEYNKTPLIQDSLMKELKEYKIVPEKAFGIYYDNPNTSKKLPQEYHSIVGLILDSTDYDKIDELTKRGFRIEKMGKTYCTTVHFPKKSNLSVILGIFKAYPALNKYRKEKNYGFLPAIEIYSKNEILYAMEINTIAHE